MLNNEEVQNRPVIYEAGGQEVKLTPLMVKNYLTRGNDDVSDQEVVMFINLCKYQQLNPFLNEAYLVKFKGSPAQIVTSKEAYMKRAFADPNFEGMKAGIIVQRGEETIELEGSFSLPGDQLLGGWAEIYVQGKKYPYVTKINLSEFNKGKATWSSMPKTMIRKTALVQALREAFPDKLGAIYTEEEQEMPRETQAKEEATEEIEKNANKQVIDIDEDEVETIKESEEPEPNIQEPAPSEELEQKTVNETQPTQEKVEKTEDLYDGPGF